MQMDGVMQLMAYRGSAVVPVACQADGDGVEPAPIAPVVGVVEALAERAVDGGVTVETGVSGATVVGVVPRMPATAFFCAAVGAGDDDEQAARTSPARSVRATAQQLRGLIASDRLVSSGARGLLTFTGSFPLNPGWLRSSPDRQSALDGVDWRSRNRHRWRPVAGLPGGPCGERCPVLASA
jgi:hypothetical protein